MDNSSELPTQVNQPTKVDINQAGSLPVPPEASETTVERPKSIAPGSPDVSSNEYRTLVNPDLRPESSKTMYGQVVLTEKQKADLEKGPVVKKGIVAAIGRFFGRK